MRGFASFVRGSVRPEHRPVMDQRSSGGRPNAHLTRPRRHPRGSGAGRSVPAPAPRRPAAVTPPRAALAAPRPGGATGATGRRQRANAPAKAPEGMRPPTRAGSSRSRRSSRPSGSRSIRGAPEQRQPVRLRMGEHTIRHSVRGPDGVEIRRFHVADGQQLGVQQAGVRDRRCGLQGLADRPI